MMNYKPEENAIVQSFAKEDPIHELTSMIAKRINFNQNDESLPVIHFISNDEIQFEPVAGNMPINAITSDKLEKAIKKLVEYTYSDEKKHYIGCIEAEDGSSDNHIFHSIHLIAKTLGYDDV
jgi:hypothetical protein